jgi:hypothetical protein
MWVQFLPDGKHFIYLARTSLTSRDRGENLRQSLGGGIRYCCGRVVLLRCPTTCCSRRPDSLCTAHGLDSFEKIGEPLLVARTSRLLQPVWALQNSLRLKPSAYPGTAASSSFDQFNWYSRDGNVIGNLEPVIDFQQFTLSPVESAALNSFRQHLQAVCGS